MMELIFRKILAKFMNKQDLRSVTSPSLLSNKMAEEQGKDDTNSYCYFSSIPIEVTEEILSYLSSYGELQQAKLVCKTWHSLVGRICLQRERYFYDSVCRGKLCFRVVQQRSRMTPCQRFSHSSCVVGKSMYIFGGCSTSNTAFNDVYELDLKDLKWSKLRLSGIPPPPKECATMVVHQNRIILFGGWCQPSRLGIVSNAKFYNGVHVLNTETLNWSAPFTAKDWPQPCERAGHAACVVQDQMIMFGGAQRQTRYNDVWMLDLKLMCWSMPEITGKRPASRFGHSQMKINAYTVLILGGCGGPNMLFSDVWLLHLKTMTWSEIQVRNTELEAPQLWCHPALNVMDRIIVFSTPKNRVVSESGDAQGAANNAGQRSPSSTLISPTRMQMYTLDCSQLMTDSCCKWQQAVETSNAPIATSLHSVVIGRGEIIIFGGIHYTNRLHNSQTVVNTLVRVTPCL